MKIIYMGTPDFAVPALEALVKAGHDVALVVTKADRPKDRGKKIQSCPVKLKALELGLNVESPEKIKGNTEFFEQLKAIEADFICVAAYGKILPKEILELPKYACVNIHGSLLPKYRGPAPIHRAVIDGEQETGVTIMQMAEGMDTGDMYTKASVEIGEKTTEDLHIELAELGAKLLIDTLPGLANGSIKGEPQDDSLSSYAPMVFKEEGIVDFSKSANEIICLVRGFYSWPTASTKLHGEVLKLHKGKVGREGDFGPYGTVISADKNGLEVACKGGTVIFTNIQAPGKKAMDVSAYFLGNKIEIGTVLG